MGNPNPILDEIYRLSKSRRNGTLVLAGDTGIIELHFRDGEIGAASSDIPRLQIGRFLSQNGFVKGSSISDLLREARKKAFQLGEAAVKRRLLENTELAELLRDQILELTTHALTSGFEVQDFKATIPQLYRPVGVSSQELILELARRSVHPFDPDPRQRIFLNNGHGFADVSWSPQELSVISGLKTPRTIQELTVFTGLEYPRLTKILSVLHNLHMITTIENEPTGPKPAAMPAEALQQQIEAEAREEFRDPSLESVVPEIPQKSLGDKLDVVHNPSSFISEQFKSLKVRLHECSAERPTRVITVSSPYTSDGKSLVCSNLGLCFAKDPNRRVLLIDCDLRNPTIHRQFGVSIGPGLVGYLSDKYLQPHCYMRRIGRLFIMTAGEVSTDPIELLSQDRMRHLLERLKGDFDTILIDTPPLGLVSDAKILTELSDGLIMVVRSNRTTYTDIERSFRLIDQSKLLGLVLNDVRALMFNTHYDYRYYHYSSRSVYPYGPKMKKNAGKR